MLAGPTGTLKIASSPLDPHMIESYYPEADFWTLEGTWPAESISRLLQALLDGNPTGSP